MRLSIAAAILAGLTVSAAAQMMGPGMAPPGAAPGFGAPPPQQQLPPCFAEFAPIRAEAEKRAKLVQAAMKKKVAREEACKLIKSFSEQEAKLVTFIKKNSASCGIPPEAATQMQKNHARTVETETKVCSADAGPAKPTGPGLSEALGTTRGAVDAGAPKNGTFDTLTGNVLTR